MNRKSGLVLGFVALVCTLTSATANAAATDIAFDAINGFESDGRHDFTLIGIRRGANFEAPYRFVVQGSEGLAETCERMALTAMRDAGHFRFVVVGDESAGSSSYAYSCRLERR